MKQDEQQLHYLDKFVELLLIHNPATFGNDSPQAVIERAYQIAFAFDRRTQQYYQDISAEQASRGKANVRLEKSLRPQLLTSQTRCVYCQEKLNGDIHVDHIEPVKLNGDSQLPNLVVTCGKCNTSKGAKTLWAFIAPFPMPKKLEIVTELLRLKKKMPLVDVGEEWAFEVQVAAEDSLRESTPSQLD
jgi:hypothetical protein